MKQFFNLLQICILIFLNIYLQSSNKACMIHPPRSRSNTLSILMVLFVFCKKHSGLELGLFLFELLCLAKHAALESFLSSAPVSRVASLDGGSLKFIIGKAKFKRFSAGVMNTFGVVAGVTVFDVFEKRSVKVARIAG